MRFFTRAVAGSLVAVLSLCLLGAASAAPKAATTVNVTITDKAIKLSPKSVTVGDVAFAVKNAGTARHNFSIGGKKTADLKPNQTATLTVTFSKTGPVAYSSTDKGDAKRGLKGTFTLNPAPAAPSYDPINVLAAASLTDVFPAIDGKEKY